MDDYIYSQSVHKDFHGIMGYLIKFMRDNHGQDHMKKFFRDSAKYIYRPLIDRIREKGLSEIRKHYEKVFDMEEGKCSFKTGGSGELIMEVQRCPAIWHMKDTGTEIDKDFCLCSTQLVNESMAEECGTGFSVEYDQDNGKCIQRFWKE